MVEEVIECVVADLSGAIRVDVVECGGGADERFRELWAEFAIIDILAHTALNRKAILDSHSVSS